MASPSWIRRCWRCAHSQDAQRPSTHVRRALRRDARRGRAQTSLSMMVARTRSWCHLQRDASLLRCSAGKRVDHLASEYGRASYVFARLMTFKATFVHLSTRERPRARAMILRTDFEKFPTRATCTRHARCVRRAVSAPEPSRRRSRPAAFDRARSSRPFQDRRHGRRRGRADRRSGGDSRDGRLGLPTLFDKIVSGDIPADIYSQRDALCMAFATSRRRRRRTSW